MPRTEARIFTSIWGDPDFLALPGSAQRLYMFLLSQRDLTYCGVMPFRPSRWAGKAAGLTERELSILKAVAKGLSNAAIGKELWVTEQTVKFHLTNIYRKLNVTNRTQAARQAHRLNLLSTTDPDRRPGGAR